MAPFKFYNVFSFMLFRYSYESVRWLVQKGSVDEAEAIVQVIAKSKSVSPPGGKFLRVPDEGVSKKEDIKAPSTEDKVRGEEPGSKGESQGDADPKTKRFTVLDLFKTRRLVFRSLVMFYCW